ncbi:hypothetical protein ACT3RM_16760 [Pseudoalteromonas sp. AOP7-A1-14]|uniref:hypothetical protein n=1 Tax=Pseudoalteromonas sp. AOP7-A1-14 TaxID=3457648 RepID=UPI00402B93EA
MKTELIALLVLISASLGLWYSIDVLSSTTLLIEENGGYFRDNYTTTERFFALWPISIIAGLVVTIIIAAITSLVFDASQNSEVKILKDELKQNLEHYESLKIQCVYDVKNAQEQARKKAEIEVENQHIELEERKSVILKKERELMRTQINLSQKLHELNKTIDENNQLVKHYKQEAQKAKNKAKNHSTAIERKNNILSKLKTDPEYLNRFIEENYN